MTDPMEAWCSFKPNTVMYARLFLETGALPASCHYVIAAKLKPWIDAVDAGGPELRDALLAIVPSVQSPTPRPTRSWVMSSTDSAVNGGGQGGVTRLEADVRDLPQDTPTGVTPPTPPGAVIPFPLGTEACKTCGKAFKPYRPKAAFCSNACKMRDYRRKKVSVEAAPRFST